MKKVLRSSLLALFIFIFLLGSFFWMEAQKEVEAYCNLFAPGLNVDEVISTLNTNEFLSVERKEVGGMQLIFFDSEINFGTSSCTMSFANEEMVSWTFSEKINLTEAATLLFSVLAVKLILLQIALIFGAPLGFLVWGGKFPKKIPAELRIRSAVSMVILFLAVLFVLENVGIIQLFNARWFTVAAIWVLTIVLVLHMYLNLNSESKAERFFMTPIIFLMTISSGIVGLSF